MSKVLLYNQEYICLTPDITKQDKIFSLKIECNYIFNGNNQIGWPGVEHYL